MEKTILRVEDLSKRYQNNIVLEKINIEFKLGHFYALLGENGAGKSTLMRLLSQYEQPTSGNIFYENMNLKLDTNTINTECVYIDEGNILSLNYPLIQWANIFQKSSKRYNLEKFNSLAYKLNLDTNKNFYSLSRGQKIKAIFALNAGKEPKIYLLDEITSVLDIGSRLTLVNFLEKEIQNRNCTVIMSTNIASELPFSNIHICFLKNGKMELNSQSKDINNLFKKFIAQNQEEEDLLISNGAKLISNNTNKTKSYILPYNQIDNLKSITEDRREILISEVIIYYTSNEMRDER